MALGARVLNHELRVVWTEQVSVDTDLPEYGCARLGCPALLCRKRCTDAMVLPVPSHSNCSAVDPQGDLGRSVARS